MPRASSSGRSERRAEWTFTEERRSQPRTAAADRESIAAWFAGSLRDGWFVAAPTCLVDDYEVHVVGELPAADLAGLEEGSRRAAEIARIEGFRSDSRDRRIAIATEAEARFGRKVSWGVRVGGTTRMFTTASVPVMTRLHLRQRRTLDTLVEAGVARSRSEALAWCVELVGRNEAAWIERLREALDSVVQAREEGPASERGE